MFRTGGTFQRVGNLFKSKFIVQCEGLVDSADEASVPSLIEQANASLEQDKPRIRTPPGYDAVKSTINGTSVSTFDGFRLGASKQVNLNTVVSHFYWIGSQAAPPIYQYRLILPFDDGKLVNISTDAEFASIDAEFKLPLGPQQTFKVNLGLPQDGYSVSGELEVSDDSSTTQVEVQQTPGDTSVSISYMQAITPFITLGGIGTFSAKSSSVSRGLAAIYADKDNSVHAQWDQQLKIMYMRKVNPNRVHLTADVTVDESGNSTASVGADYTLKQSRLHMNVDSNVTVRSVVEVNTGQGFQLQFSGELAHLQGASRFGVGLLVG